MTSALSSRLAMLALGLIGVLSLALLLAPAISARTASGTPGADALRGTDDDDVLRGLAGNDRILGLDDDDRLFGGRGNDVLDGGDDDDRLYGGGSNDRIIGDDDNDLLAGGVGNDTILARDGERDVVNCGPGRDRTVVDQRDRVSGCEVVQRANVGDDDDRDGPDDADDRDD